MKTSARFLAMLLAVVMIASAALSVSAFDDIAGNKHADAINVLSQLGIVGGYEDGTFKPDQKVTRAEMAKLVYVLYTTFVDAGTAKTEFKDVKADHWATGYINWCSGKEIIGGFGDGTFAPNANVTYDQALKMVAGALGYKNWDSKLWPTDVRMKALNELKLGKELDGVDGSAELTRAQVAQIIYNAFEAPMAEKKTDVIPGIMIPVEKAKTLKEDVWGFEESTKTVTGTKNYALENGTKVDEDMIQLDGDAVALEDLGLAAYEGKTDALIGLDITVVTRNGELLSAATVSGTVVDGVKVAVSTDKKTITINGVSYKSTSENVPAIWTLDESIADEAIFNGEVVADTVANTVAAPYIARAIDTDGDGKIDAIVLASKAIYKAGKEVEVDDVKYVEYTDLEGANKQKFVASQMTATIKEGDVFVAAKISDIVYVEVVAPVEATATKINSSKVTLDTAGDVAHGTRGFAPVTISDEVLGVKQNYWIYNGEIILADAIDTDANSSYNFAILKEVVKGDRVFNEDTKAYETSYLATLVVDGSEKSIVLAAEDSLVIGNDKYTAAEAFGMYANETVNNQRSYKYTVVANYEETKAGYVVTIDVNYDAEKFVILTNAVLSYDADTDLYTVNDGTADVSTKVVLDANSDIYYTYVKEETGDYRYLGVYTQDTIIKEDFAGVTAVGTTYLAKNDDRTYTLLCTLVENEIAIEVVEEPVNFKTDGRAIYYCYKDALETLDVETGETYYVHYFMDINSRKKFTTFDKERTLKAGATKTAVGYFYGYDIDAGDYTLIRKRYLETKSIESVTPVKLECIVNDVLFSLNGDYVDGIKLDSSINIWVPTDTDVAKKIVASKLEEMLKEVEYAGMNAIIVTYVDEDGEEKVCTIIVEDTTVTKPFVTVHKNFEYST